MAAFCEKCGFPQGVTSAFCPQCGARHSAGAPGPGPAPQAMPLPSAATSGSGVKVLLVVLGILGVLGVAAIGGVYYVAHRVKQVVVQKAEENGVDLGSISSPIRHGERPAVKLRKPCDYLSKEDVSRLIGEPIERAEVKEAMCMYYGPAGLGTKLAEEQASNTMKKAQAPNAEPDGMEVANAVDQMVNNAANGEMPLLMVGLDADGKAQMTAVTATNAIFGGLFKAAGAKGSNVIGDVAGLGDRAARVPKLGLNVLKGEILIRIIPGPFPDANAKTIDVARAILPKI